MGSINGKTDSGRFLISYDHEAETPSHRPNVLAFCRLLRAEGLDVHIDADVEGERQNWVRWMTSEIVEADRVLMVVSQRYRCRFESDVSIGSGSGVEIEAKLIGDEIARDPAGSERKFVPVLLPGADVDDIPRLLQPYSATYYPVRALTADGVRHVVDLLRRPVIDTNSPPRADPSGDEADEAATGALWLSAGQGSPSAVTDVLTAFTAGNHAAVATRFAEGSIGGALLTGTPSMTVAHLLRLGRTLPGVVERHRTLAVTVGGCIDRGPAAAAAGAQWMAAGRAATRLHTEPHVGLVVVVSPEFHAAMSGAPRAVLAAYRASLRDGDEGIPVHLGAPGRSRCPELSPDTRSAAEYAAATTVTGNSGDTYVNYGVDNRIDNSDSFHVVAGRDVIFGRRTR